jgi:hypothetical protein
MTLRQARQTLPVVRGNKPPHYQTIYRWSSVGLVSKSGRRVKLSVRRIGGSVMTTAEALQEFFNSLDDCELVFVPAPVKQVSKRADAAMEYLRSEGVI